jgi:hypothetical protein
LQQEVDLTEPVIDSTAASIANNESVDHLDIESEASSDSSEDEGADPVDPTGIVSVRGVEPFQSHVHVGASIVAERVSTHGRIRPFEPISEVEALHPDLRHRIGQIHGDGAILKWSAKRDEWDQKYASALKKFRKAREADRARAEVEGFWGGGKLESGERPPLCSLAGLSDEKLRKEVGKSVDKPEGKTSGPMAYWMKMGSKVSHWACLL